MLFVIGDLLLCKFNHGLRGGFRDLNREEMPRVGENNNFAVGDLLR